VPKLSKHSRQMANRPSSRRRVSKGGRSFGPGGKREIISGPGFRRNPRKGYRLRGSSRGSNAYGTK